MKNKYWIIYTMGIAIAINACKPNAKNFLIKNGIGTTQYITYGDDLTFIKKYTPIMELSDELGGNVAISPNLQG